ncbi:MAG: biotin/lipoyl-containing protein [Terriglobales bacterium]
MIYDVTIDGAVSRVDLNLDRAAARWRCLVGGREVEMDVVLSQPDVLSILIEGKVYQIRRERLASGLRIWIGDQSYAAEVSDPRSLRGRQVRGDAGKGPRHLVAPMPGKVVRFLVSANSPVEAGQGVVVVEAMKMQNEIKSPKKGIVLKLSVSEGAAVNAGDVLAIVE